MKATIKLTEKEVEHIILEHLLTKFKVVNSVDLKVGERSVGSEMYATKEVFFKSAECEVELT